MRKIEALNLKNDNDTAMVCFNCNDEYLERDNNILYMSINGNCMSLDKDEMIELRDHLNKMIEFKKSIDSKKERVEKMKKIEMLKAEIFVLQESLNE
jgi:phosphopantothenate synthetase